MKAFDWLSNPIYIFLDGTFSKMFGAAVCQLVQQADQWLRDRWFELTLWLPTCGSVLGPDTEQQLKTQMGSQTCSRTAISKFRLWLTTNCPSTLLHLSSLVVLKENFKTAKLSWTAKWNFGWNCVILSHMYCQLCQFYITDWFVDRMHEWA